jgi:hypothetical protein
MKVAKVKYNNVCEEYTKKAPLGPKNYKKEEVMLYKRNALKHRTFIDGK